MKWVLAISIMIGVLTPTMGQQGNLVDQVLSFQVSELGDSKLEQLRHEYASYNEDYGLSFQATLNHRFGEGFIEQDLTESSLQTYYKAGLTWDLLKNGMWSNRYTSSSIQTELKLQQLLVEEQTNNESYFAQYALAEYIFNKAIHEVYAERVETLSPKKELFISLKEEGYFTSEDILEIESREQETELQLLVLSHSMESFELIFRENLIDFKLPEANVSDEMPFLNLTEMIDVLEASELRSNELELRKEMAQSAPYWVSELSLKANVYYNHYVSFSNNRRDFVSAGLSVTVPISSNIWHKKNEQIAEIRIIEDEYFLEQAKRKKELLILYTEYSYKQKQLKNLGNAFRGLLDQERINLLQRKSVDADLPAVDASLIGDDLYLVQIELLDTKKQMVKLLLKMHLLLDEASVSDFFMYATQPDMLTELRGN